jgi:hypothetical protein
MNIPDIAAICGIFTAAFALLLNITQIILLKRQIAASASVQVYLAALEWDRLLLNRPELRDALENVDESTDLTPDQLSLAEYRLDLLELVYFQNKHGVYAVEPHFLYKAGQSPLIRKALRIHSIRSSLKVEFLKALEEYAW